jgi:hypothetical protein
MTTMKIARFAEVFPEASFVLAHRDPFRALVSSCATGDAICQAFLDGPPGPLHEDGLHGQESFDSQKRALRALVEFVRDGSAPVVDVRYADLMRDAVATTRSIYERLRMDPPEGLEQRIADHLREQRSGRRAAPPRELETYGYQADAVWSDPVVTEYCESFGVPRERTRTVDTRTGA